MPVSNIPKMRPTRNREPAWLKPRDLFVQYVSALDELLRAQFVRAGGGARDDVGDAEPEAEQLFLLVGPEDAAGEAGAVQSGPEAVPGPREMVSGGGGVQAGVDAREHHPQAGRDDIGDRPVPRRVEVALRRTRRAHRGFRHGPTLGYRERGFERVPGGGHPELEHQPDPPGIGEKARF